jgi:hypothetical protein
MRLSDEGLSRWAQGGWCDGNAVTDIADLAQEAIALRTELSKALSVELLLWAQRGFCKGDVRAAIGNLSQEILTLRSEFRQALKAKESERAKCQQRQTSD